MNNWKYSAKNLRFGYLQRTFVLFCSVSGINIFEKDHFVIRKQNLQRKKHSTKTLLALFFSRIEHDQYLHGSGYNLDFGLAFNMSFWSCHQLDKLLCFLRTATARSKKSNSPIFPNGLSCWIHIPFYLFNLFSFENEIVFQFELELLRRGLWKVLLFLCCIFTSNFHDLFTAFHFVQTLVDCP